MCTSSIEARSVRHLKDLCAKSGGYRSFVQFGLKQKNMLVMRTLQVSCGLVINRGERNRCHVRASQLQLRFKKSMCRMEKCDAPLLSHCECDQHMYVKYGEQVESEPSPTPRVVRQDSISIVLRRKELLYARGFQCMARALSSSMCQVKYSWG